MNKQSVVPLGDLIVEQTAEAVIYSNRDGVIERWNAAATAMFGYSAGEALGQSLDLIIPERMRAAHWRGFEHKTGSKLYVEMSFAVVVDAAGTALGSVAIARDVTERIERERATAPGA